MTQMTQADSRQAASWRGVRLRDHDPNDPKPTADSVQLRARGSRRELGAGG